MQILPFAFEITECIYQSIIWSSLRSLTENFALLVQNVMLQVKHKIIVWISDQSLRNTKSWSNDVPLRRNRNMSYVPIINFVFQSFLFNLFHQGRRYPWHTDAWSHLRYFSSSTISPVFSPLLTTKHLSNASF